MKYEKRDAVIGQQVSLMSEKVERLSLKVDSMLQQANVMCRRADNELCTKLEVETMFGDFSQSLKQNREVETALAQIQSSADVSLARVKKESEAFLTGFLDQMRSDRCDFLNKTHDARVRGEVYTRKEINDLLEMKADIGLLEHKADLESVYLKHEMDAWLHQKTDVEEFDDCRRAMSRTDTFVAFVEKNDSPVRAVSAPDRRRSFTFEAPVGNGVSPRSEKGNNAKLHPRIFEHTEAHEKAAIVNQRQGPAHRDLLGNDGCKQQ
jgi:hypothetical protein